MNSCPNCKASFIGGVLPEHMREGYSPPYFWMRHIGIDGGRMGIYDGIVAYRCPDCHHEFPRNKSKWAKEMFLKYQNAMQEK